jgi:hypothetical protein
VKLDINRLFSKHLAILAQSGAGKSYLLAVIIEELLSRAGNSNAPAMILIDVHGEYHFSQKKLNEKAGISNIGGKIQRFNGSFLQIGVPLLSEYDFKQYQPSISYAQMRELRKAIRICRKRISSALNKQNKKMSNNTNKRETNVKNEKNEKDEKNEKNEKDEKNEKNEKNWAKGYDIPDLIHVLENEIDINTNVQDALIGWLTDLEHLHIFSKNTSPSLHLLAKINQLVIIDFSTLISMRKKTILLQFFTSQLFYLRRQNKIPPFILFLEEAHNFLPEKASKSAIAKPILETIAREGRKFFAQLVLISQRPVRLSTTVLSQCNSQIIMRITNPYDLQHIKETSERLNSHSVKLITTLPTGNALILGTALNYPIFLKVRSRNVVEDDQGETLTEKIEQFSFKVNQSSGASPPKPKTIPIYPNYVQEDFIQE